MAGTQLRRRLAASRAAPFLALGTRLSMVARYDVGVLRRSVRWLVRSREHTNLTYDLTALNREHLAWFVAEHGGVGVAAARDLLREIEDDTALRSHIAAATNASARRGISDGDARYARRIGWYALVRARKPVHVVETGTDKGLGACVLAAALLRNGTGRLTTIDLNPDSGFLIGPPYSSVIDRVIDGSVEHLAALTDPVDMFIHDSDHAAGYERREFEAVAPHLASDAIVLSDNAHSTNELATWAEARGWRFAFFDERPADHWYTGEGIGVALPAIDSGH